MVVIADQTFYHMHGLLTFQNVPLKGLGHEMALSLVDIMHGYI
jgi:hypothetical protein